MTVERSAQRGDNPSLAFPLSITSEPSRIQYGCKRLLDIVLALVGLLLLSPLVAAIALIIKLDSPGPVLFRQMRVGRFGKPFLLYKFRSMQADADANSHQEAIRRFAQGKPLGKVGGRPIYKTPEDRRVTGVGKVLRAYSLDELPQLINVLKGEMSIVGPRPAIHYELDFCKPHHYVRFAVKPGITGLWQIEGRSQVTFDEMMQMDIQYVESFSLWLDLRIVLRTVPVVLFGKGGY